MLGIVSFVTVVLVMYPIKVIGNSPKILDKSESKTLEELFRLRSFAQIGRIENYPNVIDPWQREISSLKDLQESTGIGVIPLIDHLIDCERDLETLKREFRTRSSTATGASLTLSFMPLLMWLIGISIGVDVFGFLSSWLGIAVLLIGGMLTLISRLLLRRLAFHAVLKPNLKSRKTLSRDAATLVGFVTVISFQTNYFGFVVAVFAAIFIHNFWNLAASQNPDLQTFVIRDQQHFELIAISCLIDAGLTWTTALSNMQNPELLRISERIQMGFTAQSAFTSSSHWQEVGNLIAESMQRGTRIARDLKILASEYRQQSLNYRIQHCERIAGRLIIPVNLLQLPAFILLGLVPIVAPLLMQTLDAFHI